MACCLAIGSLAACATAPRPVGPTGWSGRVPAPEVGLAATAARAPDATDGPVLVTEPRFRWLHASDTVAVFSWTCALENPSSTALGVTVVVQLLDAAERMLASGDSALLLAGGERTVIEGEVSVDTAAAGHATGWRLDYWIRVPPPPDRRIRQDP